LRREIPVVPVLLDEARMAGELELPEEIRLLGYKQAMRLRHERFNVDADGIGAAIQALLAGPPRAGLSYWLTGLALAVALALGVAVGPIVQRGLGLSPDRTEATLELQAQLKGEAQARAEAQSKQAEAEKQARAQAERRSSLDAELSRTKERIATLQKELEKAKSEAAEKGGRASALETQLASRRQTYGAYLERTLKSGQRVRLLVDQWGLRGPDIIAPLPLCSRKATSAHSVGAAMRARHS
jgi:hypothetical protein